MEQKLAQEQEKRDKDRAALEQQLVREQERRNKDREVLEQKLAQEQEKRDKDREVLEQKLAQEQEKRDKDREVLEQKLAQEQEKRDKDREEYEKQIEKEHENRNRERVKAKKGIEKLEEQMAEALKDVQLLKTWAHSQVSLFSFLVLPETPRNHRLSLQHRIVLHWGPSPQGLSPTTSPSSFAFFLNIPAPTQTIRTPQSASGNGSKRVLKLWLPRPSLGLWRKAKIPVERSFSKTNC